MTDIPSALKKIQQEEVKYGQAVSEATQTKIGASINYIVDNFNDIPVIHASVGLPKKLNNPNFTGAISESVSFDYYCPFGMTYRGFDAQAFFTLSKAGSDSANGTFTITISKNGTDTLGTITRSASVLGGNTSEYPINAISSTYRSASSGATSVSAYAANTVTSSDFVRVTISFSGTTVTTGNGAMTGDANVGMYFTRIIP